MIASSLCCSSAPKALLQLAVHYVEPFDDLELNVACPVKIDVISFLVVLILVLYLLC